jgi:hypothetical protein
MSSKAMVLWAKAVLLEIEWNPSNVLAIERTSF